VIRVGVIGNRDYPGLDGVVQRLESLAPVLDLDLCYEAPLADLIGRSTGSELDRAALDVLVTLGGDGAIPDTAPDSRRPWTSHHLPVG
jgi:hypothetical protein